MSASGVNGFMNYYLVSSAYCPLPSGTGHWIHGEQLSVHIKESGNHHRYVCLCILYHNQIKPKGLFISLVSFRERAHVELVIWSPNFTSVIVVVVVLSLFGLRVFFCCIFPVWILMLVHCDGFICFTFFFVYFLLFCFVFFQAWNQFWRNVKSCTGSSHIH